MATVGSIEKNNRRKKMTKSHSNRRQALKNVIMDRTISPEERMKATIKLSEMPRNGAKIRIRNRCSLTGRSRGNYRKFGISRIMLRELASFGMIPGVKKASW